MFHPIVHKVLKHKGLDLTINLDINMTYLDDAWERESEVVDLCKSLKGMTGLDIIPCKIWLRVHHSPISGTSK